MKFCKIQNVRVDKYIQNFFLLSRWEARSREGQRRDSIKIHILLSAHVQFGLTSASIYFRKDFALSVSAFTNVSYPVSDCWILTYHICFCCFPSFPWSDLIILFKLDFSLPMKSFFFFFSPCNFPMKTPNSWSLKDYFSFVCVLEGRSWRFRKWLVRELLSIRLQFNVLSISLNSRNLVAVALKLPKLGYLLWFKGSTAKSLIGQTQTLCE